LSNSQVRFRPPRTGRWRGKCGQALTEFALVLPLLLLITIGVVDGVRIFAAQVALTNGVREGALYASIDIKSTYWCMDPATAPAGSIACPTGYVAARAASVDECGYVLGDPVGNLCPDPQNLAYRVAREVSGLDTSRITLAPPVCTTSADVAVTCDDGSAANVRVSATYNMDLLVPVIADLLGHPVRMTASATAPIFR
jgi:Flp pilus assembly protein TadG